MIPLRALHLVNSFLLTPSAQGPALNQEFTALPFL